MQMKCFTYATQCLEGFSVLRTVWMLLGATHHNILIFLFSVLQRVLL